MTWNFGLGVIVLLGLAALFMVWRSPRRDRRKGSPDGASVWMTGSMGDGTAQTDTPGGPQARADDASPQGESGSGDSGGSGGGDSGGGGGAD